HPALELLCHRGRDREAAIGFGWVNDWAWLGAPSRNRTRNLRFTKPLHYRCAIGPTGTVAHHIARPEWAIKPTTDRPAAIRKACCGPGTARVSCPANLFGSVAMARPFKVACAQNCAEREMAPSIAALEPLVQGAIGAGADLIVLPELAAMFEPDNARLLAQAGALYLAIPAAFTYTTGSAHWHVLVRARAIETGCYVFAANQGGTHAEGKRTWGHSLNVDPWGKVLADGGEAVGFITAEID